MADRKYIWDYTDIHDDYLAGKINATEARKKLKALNSKK